MTANAAKVLVWSTFRPDRPILLLQKSSVIC